MEDDAPQSLKKRWPVVVVVNWCLGDIIFYTDEN